MIIRHDSESGEFRTETVYDGFNRKIERRVLTASYRDIRKVWEQTTPSELWQFDDAGRLISYEGNFPEQSFRICFRKDGRINSVRRPGVYPDAAQVLFPLYNGDADTIKAFRTVHGPYRDERAVLSPMTSGDLYKQLFAECNAEIVDAE